MTATIYARVSEELKAATDQYADDHGMSLASAVADLLGRGLEHAAGEDSVARLEGRAHALQTELGKARGVAEAMEARLQQVLGTCQCGASLAGVDLLVNGRCPSCRRGVAGLLAGSTEGGSVNRGELAPFMTGLGVALALLLLAYAASKESLA